MSNVFISYRRADSAPYAGRICDRLEQAFGSEHVFMDVDDIAPGQDFAEVIDKIVLSCDVVVAIIGPRWLETLRTRGDEQDFVVHEVASALRRGVTVMPILVGGAAMPSQSELPSELKGLARKQAVTIRDAGFDQDINELVRSIRRGRAGGRSAKRLVWLVVAIGVVAALIGTAVFLAGSRERSSLNGAWIARMERPGQRPYNIRLLFKVSGRTLSGQVDYPTGSGAIEGGTFQRDSLAFFTRHVPQFEQAPVTILFAGDLRGQEIQLTATTPDAIVTKGTARKVN